MQETDGIIKAMPITCWDAAKQQASQLMEQGFPADPPRGYLYGTAYCSAPSSCFASLAVMLAAAAFEAVLMDCTYCSPYRPVLAGWTGCYMQDGSPVVHTPETQLLYQGRGHPTPPKPTPCDTITITQCKASCMKTTL